jgi:hypothetical protein
MSLTELKQLDNLIEIAEEDDSPLSEWERDFVMSLDGQRHRSLSDKQATVFERLISKHLRGD